MYMPLPASLSNKGLRDLHKAQMFCNSESRNFNLKATSRGNYWLSVIQVQTLTMDILEYRRLEMRKTLRAAGVADAFLEMAVDRKLAYDYNPTTATEPPVQVRHPGSGPMPRGITWGANDAMLQKYSFPELMQAGFITCNNLDEIKMDEPFQPFEEEDHQDILLYCDSPDVDEREIHPIFQFDRWKGV